MENPNLKMETNNSKPVPSPAPQPNREPTPAQKTKSPRLLNWKTLLILGVAVVGFFAWKSFRGNANPAADSANPVTVAVAQVTRADLAQEQPFEAEFRPYQEIDLHAKVAGFVQKINVDIGDRVQE